MAKRKVSTFERLNQDRMNRKQRKELARRIGSDDRGREVVHCHGAGIDVGNESHYVAVAPGRDPEPVREFGSWTADLARMAEWLKSCGVEHVVMQSTGVYWIAVYEVLEKAGFQVCRANARETKNLPGRKTDVPESQWLLKLHTYGLLRNSFRPPEQIRMLRTIWRLRERPVREAARTVQHMQKAMTTMNVQLANVISDLSGATGLAIIRAILKGERDPNKLAQLRNYRMQASEEEIARSLEGHWQEDVLFELQQALNSYDFCQQQIADCDGPLQKYLAALPQRVITPPEVAAKKTAEERPPQNQKKDKRKGRKFQKNQPRFDLEAELTRISGLNLTSIDGVDVMTVATFVSELGSDMTPWKTEDQLVSWLKLAPFRPRSGGKAVKQARPKTKNRVAAALSMAASSLVHSDSYLGEVAAFAQPSGPGKAIKAMAAHLARLIYRMLTHGQAWVDRGAREHETSGRNGKNWRCNAKRRRWDSGWNRPPSADHDRTEIGVRKVRELFLESHGTASGFRLK